MNDHIKGLLALAFSVDEDSETFAALLQQLDGNDRGVYDSLPGSVSETRDEGRGRSANEPANKHLQTPIGG
jgi:hypothetical protein